MKISDKETIKMISQCKKVTDNHFQRCNKHRWVDHVPSQTKSSGIIRDRFTQGTGPT